MKINTLDNDTILKISAGEVILRPSSIVKELVENSIDAKSTNIIIEIKNGGKDKIKISDNGLGINNNEIILATENHTTSKITYFNDIYNITTMGFRGEALSSIKAMCDLTIMSKPQNEKNGYSYLFKNNKYIKNEPVAMNKGTIIICNDIFNNIPVRKKFLKTTITESNHITDLLYKISIGNPKIGFKYIKDDKVIFNVHSNETLKDRLRNLFGVEYTNNIFKIDYEFNGIKIEGYISNSIYYRANRNMQYIFVNNRYVNDNSILKTIEKEYIGKIPNGRFPCYQIFISISPSIIDVNIHPNKEKINFLYPEIILSTIKKIIEESLNEFQKIPTISIDSDENKNNEIVKNILPLKSYKSMYIEKESNNVVANINEKKYNQISLNENKIQSPKNLENIVREDPVENFHSNKVNFFKHLNIIGSIFHTYIICEYYNKMIIIDQHAAHEKIMYEKLKLGFNEKNMSQILIVPIMITLTNSNFNIYLQNKDLFEYIGYKAEIFGNNSIKINEFPLIFGKVRTEKYFNEIIDELSENNKYDNLDYEKKIIMKACKSAIKAGDQITKKEAEHLIQLLSNLKDPFTCPHGRPTFIEFSKYEFEKNFMRRK